MLLVAGIGHRQGISLDLALEPGQSCARTLSKPTCEHEYVLNVAVYSEKYVVHVLVF